jgi:hypothetical protein
MFDSAFTCNKKFLGCEKVYAVAPEQYCQIVRNLERLLTTLRSREISQEFLEQIWSLTHVSPMIHLFQDSPKEITV